MIPDCFRLWHAFLSRQAYAKFLADSDNCGDLFHSKGSGYGENLFLCGSSDSTYDCYDPALAMNGFCELHVYSVGVILERGLRSLIHICRRESQSVLSLILVASNSRSPVNNPRICCCLADDEEVGDGAVTTYGGHATQILWKDTKKVGCGLESCVKDGWRYNVLVCNFDPP